MINNNTSNNVIYYLQNIIKTNSTINNITNIHIDSEKLKGGFIADVISFKITTNEKTYFQILKYENKSENNLSVMAKKLHLYKVISHNNGKAYLKQF